MFIDKNSIIVNGVSLGQYLTEVKFSYNKLWGEDTGRNLNGDFVGSLIGIFPKLTLQFSRLTKAELEIVVPILDSPRQTTIYYDPNKKTNVTMTTYTGDYEFSNNNIISGSTKNSTFSCSLISTKKRV